MWFRIQFGASQCLKFRSFVISFDLIPCCPIYVILCIGSSLIFFSDSILEVPVWCSFCSFGRMCFVVFDQLSESFSFNSLSRNFASVMDVMNFDISNSVLNSGKLQSFSNSCNLSQ